MWSALTGVATGGSSIISYNVYWNQGNTNNVWVNLIGETSDYSATSYMATSVTEGETYQFKIRANNRWGWGDFSSVTTILAAKAPG